MTTFLAPIMEEWLFRGVLFRALSEGGRRGGSRASVVLGVVLSAVLFALAHGEPLQFAGLFFLGVVLATLVWRTRRLVPSIVTHVSFNGVAIACSSTSDRFIDARLDPTPRHSGARLDALVIIAVIFVTMWELHPSLIFSNTLITGGTPVRT